ncbi:hypothetical protein ['Paenibacillus yunnanensis' Narsing Rao et al. 2020]|uniref:hypothetical protein n=1 Tax=Paenibacillus tengchongensis TaxID=2608684 RepID=UPI0016528413|nr:hypothetical protein [Paenibacillus tengchongensis]
MNISRDAVTFIENNQLTTVSTKIRISGTLYRPLLRQHKFKGNIFIEGYDFTNNNIMTDIAITKRENGINMGGLQYQSFTSSPSSIKEIGSGMIWFDNNFRNINIWTTPTWGQKNGKEPNFFIVTGINYGQAIKTQQSMKGKFGEGFVP